MNIPESMPTLSAQGHAPNSGKACVMEYVSLLAGEEWSDTPKCTHRALALAAQCVNDSLDDDERHRLVPLIGRLFGTNATVDFKPWLIAFQHVGAVGAQRFPAHLDASSSDRQWASWFGEFSSDGPGFLSAMLDEYDRLSGRTEHRELTDSDLAELAHQVSA